MTVKLDGQLFKGNLTWFIKRTDRFNFVGRQFLGMSKKLTSALFKHVVGIILHGSGKKMFWINASPNVATMENTHPFRNRSFVNDPRVSVGLYAFSISRMKLTSSAFTQTTGPQPTRGRFLNVLKKPFTFHFVPPEIHCNSFNTSNQGECYGY